MAQQDKLEMDTTYLEEPTKKKKGWPRGKARKVVPSAAGRVATPLFAELLALCDAIDNAPHGQIGRLVDRMRVLIEYKGGTAWKG